LRAVKKAYDCIETAFGKGQCCRVLPAAANIDTSSAKYTPVWVMVQLRMALIDPVLLEIHVELLGF
jgi:hypothetical protein